MLVSVKLVGDIHIGIAEEVEVGANRLVRLQGFEDGLRGMAFVNE